MYPTDGNIVYLDRHNAQCSVNEVLNALAVERQGSQWRYAFTCCALSNLGFTQDASTSFNSQGDGQTYYLDRHTVACPSGHSLTYLKLGRNTGMSLIRYTYGCTPDARQLLVSKLTPANDDGGARSCYLDRHRLECPSGSVLNRFRLTRPSSDSISYEYRCRQVNLPSCTDKTTDWTYNGGGDDIVYLDRQFVTCATMSFQTLFRWQTSSVLTTFQLQTSGSTFRYAYRCCATGSSLSVQTYYTQWDYAGSASKNSVYLDRHDVSCGTNGMLVGFGLQRSGSQVRYMYQCA